MYWTATTIFAWGIVAFALATGLLIAGGLQKASELLKMSAFLAVAGVLFFVLGGIKIPIQNNKIDEQIAELTVKLDGFKQLETQGNDVAGYILDLKHQIADLEKEKFSFKSFFDMSASKEEEVEKLKQEVTRLEDELNKIKTE